MRLLNWWRKKREQRKQYKAIQDLCYKQLEDRHVAGKELIEALKAGNYTQAVELRNKLDSLPCPTCGRNGGGGLI